MNIKIIEEHNEIVDHIKSASQKSKNKFIFINVDSHSDLGTCAVGDKPCIGTFITYSVYNDFLKKYLWIKNNSNTSEFQDGSYECDFWAEENGELICDLEDKLFFLGEYSNDKAFKKTKHLSFKVVSEKNLNNFAATNEEWLLSIDCDYFGCANPFKDVFEKNKKEIGDREFNKIFKKYNKIKNEKDMLTFVGYLFRSNQFEISSKLTSSCFDDLYFSEAEILKKINLIIDFLKTNFNKSKCLGIVLCKSESSGYTIKESLPFILKNLKNSFERYIK